MGQNKWVGVLLGSDIEALTPVAFGDDVSDEVMRAE